ncbi:Sulfotransferase 6B1 [Strongyloides ratti]|uniref:Sulfotransferase 6B1 n=1 Tax=Strongyloides ratti TaxID=34506 RepID=A0A090L4R9_STRRB|nr:Sulfotransferase 6B1 [Strongyloides ratti]CEF62504.1 Sulfotransferase 6B1 [Strongyloides ratti]
MSLEDRPLFEQIAVKKLIEIHEKNPKYVIEHPTGDRPALYPVDGILQMAYCTPESVRSARKIIPRDDDIFICTTPKSGTTFCQNICLCLVNRTYLNGKQDFLVDSPFIEMYGGDVIDAYPSRRVLKTHFTYDWVPKSKKAKYIYCVRNPKDTLASYYFYNKILKIANWENGQFDVMFEMFMNDEIESGGYFSHIKSWLPHINDENVLFLVYEEMCKDLKGSIIKIANFVGGEALKIINNEELLEKVISECSFEGMKKKNNMFSNEAVYHSKSFIRKGGSRNWKDLMSKEQSDRLDKKFNEVFKGTILENLWIKEMKWEN